MKLPALRLFLFAVALLIAPIASGLDLLSRTRDSAVEILDYQFDKGLGKYVEKPTGLGIVIGNVSTTYDSSWVLTTSESVANHETVNISFRGKVFSAEVQYVDAKAGVARLRIPNVKIEVATLPVTSPKVGKTLYFLAYRQGEYRIQEEKVTGINDSSSPNILTTSRSVPLLNGSGAFDGEGHLVGIATSRLALGNDGQTQPAVLSVRIQSDIEQIQAIALRFHMARWDGEFGPAASLLLQSQLLVHSWLRETQGKAGKAVYIEIQQLIDSVNSSVKEGGDLAAEAKLFDQIRPYALQFLADSGVQLKVENTKSQQSETVLSCVISRPDDFRGQIVTIVFSEKAKFFSFQGRSADTVQFKQNVISAWSRDGVTTVVDRSSGNFSLNNGGNPGFSGVCERGEKKKF